MVSTSGVASTAVDSLAYRRKADRIPSSLVATVIAVKWIVRIVLLILAILALLSIPNPSGAHTGQSGSSRGGTR